MQNGSIMRSARQRGPDVWEYRWREPGPDGRRNHRRMVIGSVIQFRDKDAAVRATSALRREINMANVRSKGKPLLLDVVTGLRASELFGLKWTDIDFIKNEIRVTRSIVLLVVGQCKTEASQKPVPLDPFLARTLRAWRAHTNYKAANDWVFASQYSGGRKPYRYQSLMRNRIRVVARRVGIAKKMGWHTFRHSCATLLGASGADIKVAQELLRHASCRVTLDIHADRDRAQKGRTKRSRKPGTRSRPRVAPSNSQEHNAGKWPAAFRREFEAMKEPRTW